MDIKNNNSNPDKEIKFSAEENKLAIERARQKSKELKKQLKQKNENINLDNYDNKIAIEKAKLEALRIKENLKKQKKLQKLKKNNKKVEITINKPLNVVQPDSYEELSVYSKKQKLKVIKPKVKKRKLNGLIIRSGIKQMSKNYSSVIFIWILVLIASSLCFILSLFYDRVDNNFNILSNQSNLRDFVVDIDQNDRITFNEKELVGGEKILDYSNNDLYQQYLINTLSRKGKYYDNESDEIIGNNYFNWSRTEARMFDGLKLNDVDLTTRVIAKTGIINNIDNEGEELEDQLETNEVDKLVVYESANDNVKNPFSENKTEAAKQVVLQYNFAKKHNIKLNEIVRLNPDKYGNQLIVKNDVKDLSFGYEVNDINNEETGINKSKYSDQNWFQVVGYGTSIDFFYSYKSRDNPIPNINTEVNAYVAPEVLGLNASKISKTFSLYSYDPSSSKLNTVSDSDREVYFSAKFIDNNNYNENLLNSMNSEYIRYGNLSQKNKKLIYSVNDSTYKNFSRLSIYNNAFFVIKFVSYFFSFLIVFITIFVISQFIKKELKDSEKKIGTFKALGCSNSMLSNFFWILPTVTVLSAVLVSYCLVVFTQNYILDVFKNYINLNFGNMSGLFYYAAGILLCFVLLFYFICKTSTKSFIKRDASSLLYGVTQKRHSKYIFVYKSFYIYSKFNAKLHAALFASSFKKVMTTCSIIFISTLLLSFSSIIPFVINSNKQKAFEGLNYNSVVEYNQPLANNPYSFLKTYNPNKNNDYDYDVKNKVVYDYSEAIDKKTNFYTALPTKLNEYGNIDYDSNQIIDDLLNNDISRNYFSLNLPILDDEGNLNDIKLSKELSKLAYSNYKNYSLKYLKILNKLNVSNINDRTSTEYKTVESILNQWIDYYNLLNQIDKSISSYIGNGTNKELSKSIKSIFKELQLFYIKYDTNVRLSKTNNYIKDDYVLDENKVKNINYNNLIFTSDKNYYENIENTPNPFSYIVYNNKMANNVSKSYEGFLNSYKNNKIYYKDVDIRNIVLDNQSDSDLKILNSYLLMWFWVNFSNQIGETIFQSFYSHESDAIKENIKNALLNDKDYNFSYNLIPFDSTLEEKGTLLNGSFTLNNNLNNLKIYGIDEDTQSIDLKNDDGESMQPDLFRNVNSSLGDYYPIIVNNSLAEKFNLSVGSYLYGIKIQSNKLVSYDTLPSGNGKQGSPIDLNKQVNFGISKNHKTSDNQFYTEYKKNYYSKEEYNIGWATENNKIKVASICTGISSSQNAKNCNDENKVNIAVNNLSDINSPSDIQNKVWNSDIVSEKNDLDKNFIVVGVQKSYGDPKAWISNKNANKVLGYDNVKKYFFNNFFIQEWYKRDYLTKYYNEEIFKGFTKEQWSDFITYFNQIITAWLGDTPKYNTRNDNPYDDFTEMFLNLSENYDDVYGYKKFSSIINTIFENEYPIFNYKYKITSTADDSNFSTSKTQEYGDYTTIGLYGQRVDDEQTESFIYKDGYIKNNISSIDNIINQKDFLNKLTDIIYVVTIMIIIIVFIMSFIIIFISSVYIINENSSFIATMKTLGYTNKYIIGQIFMIYLLPIFITVTIGFTSCWFILKYLFNTLSINSSLVIPYLFSFYSPIIVFGIIFFVYLFSIYVSYKPITKISPTKVLGDQ
ncbi:ABC transporter permease [Spiroplasma turonicum]|uniref:ABC transporter permease n=1 Tax=Spiroplasma turonicum TaxID=216946 RepID=A0A0K1P5W8_9MOLU|nr:FtsX-like permease family protein [Spiroplasma turonicum]AKU79655.1 ABC transporter permease [Spiroplasma turonicum]ALX70675.1 ABC transporter permease [Spiroplasma turonicum]